MHTADSDAGAAVQREEDLRFDRTGVESDAIDVDKVMGLKTRFDRIQEENPSERLGVRS